MFTFWKENRNLAVVGLITMVSALGYGIIIPILYSYSQKFGLSDFQNGLLFAIFSVCQFLATPLIGRLSDKYGRKPLLVISLSGTTLSFLLMGFAPSAFFLFLGRALDGITAGNIPVATAVISDSTTHENRAKGFGIIGAAFSFGFVFGPAISALTVGISPLLPFLIAAALSAISVIATWLYLPETNKHLGEVKKAPLFDFKKLYEMLFDRNVGPTLIISLLYWLGVFSYFTAFQPFAVKTLGLNETQISLLFMLFGVMGLITQFFLVQRIIGRFGIKNTFTGSLMIVALAFLLLFFTNSLIPFVLAILIMGVPNALIQPLISTILSREVDAKSQGSIMGINASYMSIGQILGPILGGALATLAVSYPFLGAAALVLICFWLSFKALKPDGQKESAF